MDILRIYAVEICLVTLPANLYSLGKSHSKNDRYTITYSMLVGTKLVFGHAILVKLRLHYKTLHSNQPRTRPSCSRSPGKIMKTSTTIDSNVARAFTERLLEGVERAEREEGQGRQQSPDRRCGVSRRKNPRDQPNAQDAQDASTESARS